MKRSILTLIVLFIATNVSAQIYEPNYMGMRLGLYKNYDENCYYQQVGEIVTMPLYLHAPINDNFGENGDTRDVENVSGFECRLTTTEGITILSVDYPVEAINVGTNGSMVVGFSEPLPVVDGSVVLANVTFFFGNVSSFEIPDQIMARCINFDNAWIHMNPSAPASIAGEVAYLDADDPVDPLVTAWHVQESPDLHFELYDAQVATETPHWGALKALYR